MRYEDPRYCLFCGERIKARIDKKFCNDSCRNAYNNKFHKSINPYKEKYFRLLCQYYVLLEYFKHTKQSYKKILCCRCDQPTSDCQYKVMPLFSGEALLPAISFTDKISQDEKQSKKINALQKILQEQQRIFSLCTHKRKMV